MEIPSKQAVWEYLHSFIRSVTLLHAHYESRPKIPRQITFLSNISLHFPNHISVQQEPFKMQFSTALLAVLAVGSQVFAAPHAVATQELSKRNVTAVSENLYKTITTLEVCKYASFPVDRDFTRSREVAKSCLQYDILLFYSFLKWAVALSCVFIVHANTQQQAVAADVSDISKSPSRLPRPPFSQ